MKRLDSRRKSEVAAAFVIIVIGAFVAFYSHFVLSIGMMISPGAGFIPFLLGFSLMALGACWLTKTLFLADAHESATADGFTGCADAEETPDGLRSRKHHWGFLVILTFAVLIERAGFLFSTAIFMIAWQLIVEKEKWLNSLIITVITAGAMYTIFRLLLKIHLPAGEWFS